MDKMTMKPDLFMVLPRMKFISARCIVMNG